MNAIEILLALVAVGALALVWARQVSRNRERASAKRPLPSDPLTIRDLLWRGRTWLAQLRHGLMPQTGGPTGRVAVNPLHEELRPVAPAGLRTLVDDQPPDGRRVRELVPVAPRTLTAQRPLALMVAAEPSAITRPQQDVYYLQRNIIAIARGLQPNGAEQRAAALALSGVMSSRLGRTGHMDKALLESAKAANRLVRSIRNRQPGFSDMATTLDLVCLTDEGNGPTVYFAHVGNTGIWLHRTNGTGTELLTKVHGMRGGPLLRAVGLSSDVLPDIGRVRVRPGDRIFLTTTSAEFSFAHETIESAAVRYADDSLPSCATALAEIARSGGGTESVTVVAAEIAGSAAFAG